MSEIVHSNKDLRYWKRRLARTQVQRSSFDHFHYVAQLYHLSLKIAISFILVVMKNRCAIWIFRSHRHKHG